MNIIIHFEELIHGITGHEDVILANADLNWNNRMKFVKLRLLACRLEALNC